MIRLLDVKSLGLREFDDDEEVPPYAIASHRWLEDEISLKDWVKQRRPDSPGHVKVLGFCSFVRASRRQLKDVLGLDVDWIWIDTCCIDRKNAVELTEAINSMFRWYRKAAVCLAYLHDVDAADEPAGFVASSWHRRGWTLQELVAPDLVLFLDSGWEVIGHKSKEDMSTVAEFVGKSLHKALTDVTGIADDVLCKKTAITDVDVEAKLAWMDARTTKKVEDKAYSLLGLFGVFIPIIYGERHLARIRLLEAVLTKYGRRQNRSRTASDDDRFLQEMLYIQDQLDGLEIIGEELRNQHGRREWLSSGPEMEREMMDPNPPQPMHYAKDQMVELEEVKDEEYFDTDDSDSDSVSSVSYDEAFDGNELAWETMDLLELYQKLERGRVPVCHIDLTRRTVDEVFRKIDDDLAQTELPPRDAFGPEPDKKQGKDRLAG